MIKKVIKKPLVVSAVQLTADNENFVNAWSNKQVWKDGEVYKVIVFGGEDNESPIHFRDGYTSEEERKLESFNLLQEIFRDGKLLVEEDLSTIRARLK